MNALGPLLQLAREQLGLKQLEMAKILRTDARTLRRWEAGEAFPTPSWREIVAIGFGHAEGETWRAIVRELGLSLDVMLARVPPQRAKLPAPAQAVEPRVDPRAVLDDAVRTVAEDLDVSARRLRAGVAAILGDLERLGLSAKAGREMILERSAKRVTPG